MQKGTLYLIPVPLAEEVAHKTFTPYLVDTINQIDTYIVENSKTARRFLKEAGLKTPQKDLIVHDYGKHNRTDLGQFFVELAAGKDVGLMSEAGCPGIADPGADIVAEAHKRGIKVVPLVGPSSILLALMASGFNGQSFAFWGYLPIDKEQRTKRIKDLDLSASRYKQTQIFIETPFRNNQLFEEVLKSCKPNTQVCVASNLTAEDEFIKTQSVYNWRKEEIDLHKQPTIFLLY
ncbi:MULTISPECIES: SAM-dependent methyltransferase [Pedobacter]|jgi:16S rRNA (cytidine1402-2'-O)-methyltransferase|uniref:SAM-dependent methyltransferase n=3 Tax=Pedobacter TaxID=84567 RepID=A0A0T5VSD7_9SPHI|nr:MULTISPECIES: SAM-dependent methyltransferase [Pedobacter]ARS41568.1 SAM-dependent methyltransferase [Sphingobacteriaceae bacterium GW460-11-11-14-LB5]KRT16744.1 SAM-dependent methyltransferase [Pedobacter ginsenosidimutans]MBB6237063.1 16S rRNA (cytidine1402-2'-O)-methyltransferase [Pedobacter sp. AK013]MBT2562276.1 SAM-dependent methyltransferase [Pedobacter sp. ISL-64]MBT2588953.1 SAM-dependent methyltransferase [Pedobacter sp. ISL-68]